MHFENARNWRVGKNLMFILDSQRDRSTWYILGASGVSKEARISGNETENSDISPGFLVPTLFKEEGYVLKRY